MPPLDWRVNLVDANGTEWNASNPFPVVATPSASTSTISTTNSSTTLLAAGATFTGTYEDVSGISNILVTLIANPGSGSSGLRLQFSSDGVNADDSEALTVATSVLVRANVFPRARYFRVVYTNSGSGIQTTMRLQTIYQTLGTHDYAIPGYGRANINGWMLPIKQAAINISTNGTTTVITPAVGNKSFRILSVWMNAAGNQTLTWKTGGGSTLFNPISLLARNEYNMFASAGGWLFDCGAGNTLAAVMDSGQAAVQVSGVVNYVET